jgi:malonyl-CoA/methylmalonyl-CoA synthetase
VSELLAAWDHHDRRQVAVRDEDGAHRWADLERRSSAGAARLASSLAEGTSDEAFGPRVGMLLEPGAGWLATLMAIWRAGMVAVPLSPRYPDRELARLLLDAGATAVVHDAANARPGLAEVETMGPWLEARGLLADGPALAEEQRESLAMLLYTSGTTGRPKGVRLSHRALAHQARLLCEAWALEGRGALLHGLPLHHMHGIAIALFPCLLAGMEIRLLPRFEATIVWEALADADVFMGVPTMYHRLLEAHDAADATTRGRWAGAARAAGLCTSGSAALPVTLAGRWQRLSGSIPLERYGMTEMGVGCSNPLDPSARRRGWVGPALPTLEMRLMSDGGEPSADGAGMLQVRGPSLFDGYWRRPDATAAAFHDGWFITGDVAERDRSGFVRLRGRRSVDILKSGGYKLSALEIEEHLRDHAAVAEVAVVGLPDEIYGQVVCAAVVARPGATCTAETLRAFVAERLAPYKLPRRWHFVESLPRNALGKVRKRALVEQLSASVSSPQVPTT